MPEPAKPRPTPRDLIRVGLWGALTAGIAYGLARGSLPVAILLMVLFGIAQRMVAFRIVRARGETPPRWWWR
jgi:predicted lipid-binding transport protein (Tim44 family)